MGAPWSVYDEATIGSWVGAEVAFLRAAHDAGVPVLGICFGGQALAAALGGRVLAAGTYRDRLADRSRTERPDLVEAGPWFQWHGDRWELPDLAVRSDRRDVDCEQAFLVGRSLGMQFHPELHAGDARRLARQRRPRAALAHGVDPDALVAGTDARGGRVRRPGPVGSSQRFVAEVAAPRLR